jgi:hypothetical protein
MLPLSDVAVRSGMLPLVLLLSDVNRYTLFVEHGGDPRVLLGLTADSPFHKFEKTTTRRPPGRGRGRGRGSGRGAAASRGSAHGRGRGGGRGGAGSHGSAGGAQYRNEQLFDPVCCHWCCCCLMLPLSDVAVRSGMLPLVLLLSDVAAV